MEVMEDGNLMDKVHILIQRDMEYYTNKQTILQETICPGVIGGRLDFPRSASFASMKLVLWWEEEFIAAYRKPSGFLQKSYDGLYDGLEGGGGCGGVVKASDPTKFVSLISKSADQLLEHLHILTQEALDHADLTVLTGTIGAAALLKNCLWFYIQSMNDSKGSHVDQLQIGYKKYHEMCEALAERLLDLHCRLLSLYILQDAECLDWENNKPFSESERGSYIIQMWWLYMQGTKDDLWNTVPPKMAQRVFSGMLNESLTILTVRYTQSIPSEERSQLLIVDISNLLLCVAQLLPAICDTAEEFVGFSLHTKSKILRDVHTKCQQLLNCFILRGAPLDTLFKVFRNGIENVEILKSRTNGILPWILFALPNVFREPPKHLTSMASLSSDVAIALELMVLLAQPQPNWALLLKVLGMRNCRILKLILDLSLNLNTSDILKTVTKTEPCGSFLCSSDGICKNSDFSTALLDSSHYYDLVMATSNVILNIGNNNDFSDILLASVTKQQDWSKCFERRHVWNQIRPPWYEAILNLASPLLPSVSDIVINAVKTGASMYQAMSIILACFSQFWDCTNQALTKIAILLQDLLPAETVPLNHSTIIQILISALYSELLHKSEETKKEVKFKEDAEGEVSSPRPQVTNPKTSITSFDATLSSDQSIALAVAECLCSIDEDNKHTDQIEEFLEQVRETQDNFDFDASGAARLEGTLQMTEVLVSNLLLTNDGKQSLKRLHHFIKCNNEWLFQQLSISENEDDFLPNKVKPTPKVLLHTMFHIGYRPFDQLLVGNWHPHWFSLLQTPSGLSIESVWYQISQRWEFRDITSSKLSTHDVQIITKISSLFK